VPTKLQAMPWHFPDNCPHYALAISPTSVGALREKINSRAISRQFANNRRSNRATLEPRAIPSR